MPFLHWKLCLPLSFPGIRYGCAVTGAPRACNEEETRLWFLALPWARTRFSFCKERPIVVGCAALLLRCPQLDLEKAMMDCLYAKCMYAAGTPSSLLAVVNQYLSEKLAW